MAFEQTEVTQVAAETAVGNVPSQRVLEKVGFVRVGTRDTVEDGTVYQWCLVRQRP
jgi:RimJ/RimL family protein N-acetyltransferase